MKTHLKIFAIMSSVLLLAVSPALAGGPWYVGIGGSDTPGHGLSAGTPFATIQYAIGQASSGDVINIEAGTFAGANIPAGKSLQLIGAGESSTTITPSSGNGINVSANSVQIDSLTVTGASDNGIYAHNVSNLTIANVQTFNNGTSANGSGIYIDGITGTSALTNIYSHNNQLHGVSIDDGSNGVTINGGTFTANGVSGNTGTGGGINIYSATGSISNITVNGPINSSWNMNAGIIIFADSSSGSIHTVSIGTTGTVTLTGNGSGLIGEGVAIAGSVTTVNITAQFNEGSLPHGAGVAVVGTNSVGAHSPSGVTISNSTFTGYAPATPAITLASSSSSPTYISVNPVTATTGNTIGANGYLTEDLIYHKLDNAAVGLVTTDASNLYVTTNSGSIQRGVDAAIAGQTVNVGDGTYHESVNLNKAITLAGVDTAAFIVPPSGNGITVNANGATVKTISVRNAPGDGINASGKTGVTLWGVWSTSNSGSGAQLSGCGTVTITGGSYSNNTHEGINAVGGSSYTITGANATSNGSGSNGSGIDLDNISGPSTVTNVTASSNHHHGATIGNGTSNLAVVGGTFTLNGNAGDATTGGGVNVLADSSTNTTTSSITIDGTINASNNTTAGIYIFCSKVGTNYINGVTIGDTGWVTLTNNGSANGTYSGGAGVLVYGHVNNAHISHCGFTKGTALGSGLMNLGDSTLGGASPTGTTVSNSTFTGYTSSRPAVTLTDNLGHRSENDVVASNNTFTFPVAAKVFLQGPYVGPNMSTALNGAGYLPLSQPYSGAPFNYAGTEHVASIPSPNIVDWVLVELRAVSAGPSVARRAAFLNNNGTLLETDGSSNVSFTETLASGYTISNFIVVKHRNHLAVMSATALTVPNEVSAYNFTTAQGQAFGSNPMKALTVSVFGMYVGDFDHNNAVNATDLSTTLGYRSQSGLAGYKQGDFTMNGAVNASDGPPAKGNSGHASAVPNP